MKVADAHRAATLAAARGAFALFADNLQSDEAGTLTLMSERIASNGGYYGREEIEIDPETARKLIPTIQRLVDEELSGMGVVLE